MIKQKQRGIKASFGRDDIAEMKTLGLEQQRKIMRERRLMELFEQYTQIKQKLMEAQPDLDRIRYQVQKLREQANLLLENNKPKPLANTDKKIIQNVLSKPLINSDWDAIQRREIAKNQVKLTIQRKLAEARGVVF